MASSAWSEAEFFAAVRAYLEMLIMEQSGESYSKKEVNRYLRNGELSARSKGSIEFRMCNISAVVDGLSLPYISGYKPMGNVGPRGTKMIKDALTKLKTLTDQIREEPSGRSDSGSDDGPLRLSGKWRSSDL